jgi:hypothetical protein
MKRFVQTFVLTPADNSKQKYYVHNDIFRYQDSPSPISTNDKSMIETPITPSASNTNIEFFDNTIIEKKEEEDLNVSSTASITPPVTPVVEQTKEQTSKPKSYRDAIGNKKEKPATTTTSNENQPAKSNKSNKQQKKAAKAAANNNRAPRGHPQDANDYYDDSWYYGSTEEGYLSTGYTDDQEVFVGNLSAQVTENEVKFFVFFFFSFY